MEWIEWERTTEALEQPEDEGARRRSETKMKEQAEDEGAR